MLGNRKAVGLKVVEVVQRRAGSSDGVMRIAPPLTGTEAAIDLGLELLDAALDQTFEQLPQIPVFPAVPFAV